MPVDVKIKQLLSDVIGRADAFFRDPKERLYLEPDEDKLTATGFTAAGTLLFKATAVEELPEFDTVACFGNLRYLRAILDNPKVLESGTLTINTRKASNGQPAVHQLVFMAKRSHFTYQCHDPYLNAPTRKKGTSPAKTIDFKLTEEAVKEFEEVVRVHSQSDDDGKLFAIKLADEKIVAAFGSRGSQAQLVLAESYTDNLQTSIESYFEIAQFRDVVKQCKTGALVKLMPLGIQLEVPTTMAVYNYALKVRKKPE